MKYSIVIPTYNHCDDFLKPCIDSLIQHTDLNDTEIVIVANGCVDNTKEYLRDLKLSLNDKLKVVWYDEPLGYPSATNEGIKVSIGDKIVLLNNDTKLLNQNKNDWLNLLETSFKEHHDCGVSCIVKQYSRATKKDYAVFFCVMIDRKVFSKIGFLNTEYGKGSGEDIEFCFKLQEAGYKIYEILEKTKLDKKYFTGGFPIYHYGEGTVHDETLVPDWDSVFLRNNIKLAKKFNEDWNRMKIHNDKKVGVITPVYNDAEHLFHAINCVKSQNIDNIIHYIYDDASTDFLPDAMSEFENDSTVRYTRGEENKGQSHARNELIRQALLDGCEYIAFLDSDDFWYPTHVQESLQHLIDNDVVYSTPEFVDENSNQQFPINIPIPREFIGKQLLHNNFIWISSSVCRGSCFIKNEFDGQLNSIEDWDMWIRLFQQDYRFKKKDTTTVRYLIRNNGQAGVGVTKMPVLNQKHKMLDKLKLHLACGHDYNEDYINIDFYSPPDAILDARFDVQKLPYDDNSVDEIKAFHIIEHFHFFEIQEVLKEWYRVLKPGGRLYLETPDFLETCRSFVEGSPGIDIESWRITLYGHFFAHAWVPGQTHKFLFTDTQLRANLGWAGFGQVNRLPPASKYVMEHTKHLFLTVEAFK